MGVACVLVGRLPPTVTLAQLRAVMAQIGPVEDVSIFRRLVGSERMGTVCFADAATAERAAGQFDKKLLCPPSPRPLTITSPNTTISSEPTITPQVFVGGLRAPCLPELLYQDFARFGQPQEVRVYATCAMVQFPDFASSEKAIAFFLTQQLLQVRYADGDHDLRAVERGVSFRPSQAPGPSPATPATPLPAMPPLPPGPPPAPSTQRPPSLPPPAMPPLPPGPPPAPSPQRPPSLPLPPRPLPGPPIAPELFVSGPPLSCMAELLFREFSHFGRVEEVRAKGGKALVRFADFGACERVLAKLKDQTLVEIRYSVGLSDEAMVLKGDVFRAQTDGGATSSTTKLPCSQPPPKLGANHIPNPAPCGPHTEQLHRESAEMQQKLERREAKGPRQKRQRESSDASSTPPLPPSVKEEPAQVNISDALNATTSSVSPEKALSSAPLVTCGAPPTPSSPAPPGLTCGGGLPSARCGPALFSADFSTLETAEWLSRQLPSISGLQFAHSCGKHHIDGSVLTIACHMASEGLQQEWEALFQALQVDEPEQRQQLQRKVALALPKVSLALLSNELNVRLQWSQQQVADWFATLGLSTDYSLQLCREGIDGALLFAARKTLTFLHMVLKDALHLPLGDSIKIIFAVSHTSNLSAG